MAIKTRHKCLPNGLRLIQSVPRTRMRLTTTENTMAQLSKSVKTKTSSTNKKTKASPVRDDQIAERAFYKAEKREFAPGYELSDWFEAEQEILLEESEGVGA
jgi:Protein of unknown function (DUF2934)